MTAYKDIPLIDTTAAIVGNPCSIAQQLAYHSSHTVVQSSTSFRPLTKVFSTFEVCERSRILVSACDVKEALCMPIYDVVLICM